MNIDGEIILKLILKKMVCEGVDWIHLAQIMYSVGPFWRG
jgi:hypothetical protein